MSKSTPVIDFTERLSESVKLIANRSAVRYRIQKQEITIDEVFSVDGMLPIYACVASRAATQRDELQLLCGLFVNKKALVEAQMVIPVAVGDSQSELQWLERMRCVLRQLEQRAEKSSGVIDIDCDYQNWFADLENGKYFVGKDQSEVLEHLKKAIETSPKSRGAAASDKQREVGKFFAEVSRREIGTYLISPLVSSIVAIRAARLSPVCILVKHPFAEFEQSFCSAMKETFEEIGSPLSDNTESLVVSSADLVSSGTEKGSVMRPEALISQIAGGGNVIIFASSSQKLPTDVMELVERTLSIERFNESSLGTALQVLYDLPTSPTIIDGPWVRLVRPNDFLINAGGGSELVQDIRRTVERRLTLVGVESALSLDHISGMPEAKEWAQQLIGDIRLAELGPLHGGIRWSEVDKGALFEGPPGVGKTSIARAIAKACGLKFINVSAASWQAAGTLDLHLRAMRESFAKAAEFAPSILFIDEIDSLGNRERLSGANAQYQTEVINAVLQELDGFDGRERVIVLAATNYADNVDAALRRPGRLDRVIHIPFPNAKGLMGIYSHYLAGVAHELSEADIDAVAKASLGLTGADVELFMRSAKRVARRQGRKNICLTDLMEQVYRSPPENQRRPMSKEELHRTAVHEAGHAIIQLLEPDNGRCISYVSIVPRSDGTLGFVASHRSEDKVSLTLTNMLHDVRVLLAGRAAEAMVFGDDNVSGGAGGDDPRCDLAQATRRIEYLLTKQGHGSASKLMWRKSGVDDDEELRRLADTMLAEQYQSVRRLLADNQTDFNRVTALLLERQEVSGVELRKLFSDR